ncbi:MAG: hypothetical protein Q9187_000482 [Circinaria calcarea]
MALLSITADSKPSRIALLAYVVLFTFIGIHFLYLMRGGPLTYGRSPTAVNHTNTMVKPDFPRKIWQTSKTSPAGLDHMDRTSIQSWTKMNQKWRYEIITQYSAESYVRDRFSHRRDIEETFTDLQDPILRADLIRYLVLLGDGGVYSDIDTKSLKPIEDWVPAAYKDHANIVVGIEYDRLEGNRWIDWTLDLQFCTWAIMAKPGHPLLEMTVNRVIRGLRKLAFKQGKTISGIKPSFNEVLDTTGPALFTQSIFDILSRSTGTNFTWLNVTKLTSARLVDDILILPITAFGSGQSHSNSGSPNDDTALVEHLFKGSWKNDHPMEEKKEDSSSSDVDSVSRRSTNDFFQ